MHNTINHLMNKTISNELNAKEPIQTETSCRNTSLNRIDMKKKKEQIHLLSSIRMSANM